MPDMKKTPSKTRNWATILYPESCAPEWKEVVKSWRIPALASPVHDSDTKADGSMKKPHIHLMMMFPGAKTAACVEKLIAPIGAVGLVAVQSVNGMARYLCHMDDPDKAQYAPGDVVAFGGVDYDSLVKVKGKDGALDIMSAIMDWCDENHCYSFAKLMRYARKERKDWLEVLCSSRHSVIYRYLRSCEWEAEQDRNAAYASLPDAAPAEKPSPLDAVRREGVYLHADGQEELRAVADAEPSPHPWA